MDCGEVTVAECADTPCAAGAKAQYRWLRSEKSLPGLKGASTGSLLPAEQLLGCQFAHNGPQCSPAVHDRAVQVGHIVKEADDWVGILRTAQTSGCAKRNSRCSRWLGHRRLLRDA